MRALLIVFVVTTGLGALGAVSPANAWYDRWGRWHPDRSRRYDPPPRYYGYAPPPYYRRPPPYVPPPVYVPPPTIGRSRRVITSTRAGQTGQRPSSPVTAKQPPEHAAASRGVPRWADAPAVAACRARLRALPLWPPRGPSPRLLCGLRPSNRRRASRQASAFAAAAAMAAACCSRNLVSFSRAASSLALASRACVADATAVAFAVASCSRNSVT
jgi:hypothetical protein